MSSFILSPASDRYLDDSDLGSDLSTCNENTPTSRFKTVSKLNRRHRAISELERTHSYFDNEFDGYLTKTPEKQDKDTSDISNSSEISNKLSSELPLLEKALNEISNPLQNNDERDFDKQIVEEAECAIKSAFDDLANIGNSLATSNDRRPSNSEVPSYDCNEDLLKDNTSELASDNILADDSKVPSSFNDDTSSITNPPLYQPILTNPAYVHQTLTSSPSTSSTCSSMKNAEEDQDSILLMERRAFRPFKSSEDYLYAMREDLAEWIKGMYDLEIDADNFFEMLDTGEVLCQHANAVKIAAEEARRNGRRFSERWTVPTVDVVWRPGVEPGSFRARDNVSNFIQWCRKLGIHEVLLFETDDLVLRKNEKHVILALLEVARHGHKLGMAAPLLVQMEDDIDRHERLLEERRAMQQSMGETELQECLDSSDDNEEPPQIFYGPTRQIVTNDLRSLDEMVRDLVERCSCPSQFPMVKVSDGKYRIGDTKVTIFVRILRNHVMVRVGGGWDTLEHYLDKHDPCRCKSGHRSTVASNVSYKTSNADQKHLGSVSYDRSEDGNLLSPHPTRRRSSAAPRKDSQQQANSFRNRSKSPANFGSRLQASRLAGEDTTGRSPEPGAWCDSSSEVSDEGYKSSAPPKASPRNKKSIIKMDENITERPESSLTHTSSEGSTTEDYGAHLTPPRSPLTTNNQSQPVRPARSKGITADVRIKNMGQKKKKEISSNINRPAWNSGMSKPREEPKRRGSHADLYDGIGGISRSRSITSENGFNSLTRNTPGRKSLSATRTSSNSRSTDNGKLTWNGGRHSTRGRPPFGSDLYKPPTSLSRGVRSASASPGPVRRGFGHSAPVTPQTMSPKTSAPNSNLASPTHGINLPAFIQTKLAAQAAEPNVAMLSQLEDLVNSYRARVLDHYAEEGKAPPPALANDFSCSWARDTQSLTNSPKRTPGRSSADIEPPPLKVTPRRQGLGSRIPAPVFYPSRNTPS